MKVFWEVDDGYVGKSRPQVTIVPDDELTECVNDDEREQLIRDYVQEDFEMNITWRELSREEGE